MRRSFFARAAFWCAAAADSWRLCSWMKTAVIGSRWFSLLMARRHSRSLAPPWRPLTFLVMYRGPGLGSMPSSVRSLIHVSEGLMIPERSAVSSLVWFRFCLGLLVSGLVIWPITRGYLWVRVCRVPRASSLCVSARWHGCLVMGWRWWLWLGSCRACCLQYVQRPKG